MIQFNLNGKPINIASSWDELTYDQFQNTFAMPPGIHGLISVCAGLPYSEKFQKAQITGNIDALIQALNFVKTPAKWDTPVLQCGPYKLPINHKGQYNIQFETLGQFEDMRKIIEGIKGETSTERAKNISEAYPSMVAIYLQKIRDGEYSYNKSQEMIPEIRLMPAREVVTLGSFFLVKLLSLSTGSPSNNPTTSQSPKKSRPVSKSSRKRSARLPRSRK